MEYTFTNQNVRGLCLTIVHFSGEGKETRWARRMERFYEALGKTVLKYISTCEKEDLHSRYVCRMDATTEKDRIFVTVSLSHKRPGMVSRHKRIRYRWCRGVLESVQIE